MLLSIRLYDVQNGNTADEECVRLLVLADMNLKGYALVDRTFDVADQVSNEFRHIFVFPSLDVEIGDEVFVYTGKGTPKTVPLKSSKNRYKLYWGAETCVWNNNGGDVASLIHYTFIERALVAAVQP